MRMAYDESKKEGKNKSEESVSSVTGEKRELLEWAQANKIAREWVEPFDSLAILAESYPDNENGKSDFYSDFGITRNATNRNLVSRFFVKLREKRQSSNNIQGYVDASKVRFEYFEKSSGIFHVEDVRYDEIAFTSDDSDAAMGELDAFIIKLFCQFDRFAPFYKVYIRDARTRIIEWKEIKKGESYLVQFWQDQDYYSFCHFSKTDKNEKEEVSAELLLQQAYYSEDIGTIKKQLSKPSFLTESELRNAFKEGNASCIITGDKKIVAMAHICRQKASAFAFAVKVFVHRASLWDREKKFVTVHDLRNVLPLRKDIKIEFDKLLFTIVADSIKKEITRKDGTKIVRFTVLPINTLNLKKFEEYAGRETEIFKFWNENNGNEQAKIEERLSNYIHDNKIFKRCLYAHTFAFYKKWVKVKNCGIEDQITQFCPSLDGDYQSVDNSFV